MAETFKIENQDLGKFVQIVFQDGIRNQLSEDFADFDMVKGMRAGDPEGRSQRFMFQDNYGPSAIQWSDVSAPTAFPSAQKIGVAEYEAFFKELQATIEVEYNIWERAKKGPKYAEPLAAEIQSKTIATKRVLCSAFHGDGSGVIGEVESLSASGGYLLVVMENGNASLGHVGMFEEGDLVVVRAKDGTAHLGGSAGGSDLAVFKVISKNRQTRTITLSGSTALPHVHKAATGAGTIVANDVVYRLGVTATLAALGAGPDLTGAIADWNLLTRVSVGLESLTATDGRVVHGVTMSGSAGGLRYDAGANPLDTSHIQAALSQVKTRVGKGKYQWAQMLSSPEALDAMINAREADRRFNTVTDNKRGVTSFVYQHLDSALKAETSEYCHPQRIWMIPMQKAGEKVLELYSKDMAMVRPAGQGSEWFLRPNSAGHDPFIRGYMFGSYTLLSKHSAAIAVVTNFTV